MSEQITDLVPIDESAEIAPWVDEDSEEPSEFEKWKGQFPDNVQKQIERHYRWLWDYHRPKVKKKYFGSLEQLTYIQAKRLKQYTRHQIEVVSIAVLRAMIWRSSTDTVKSELFGWSIKQKEFEAQPAPLGLGRSVGYFSSIFGRYDGLREYLEYAPLTGRERLKLRHEERVLDRLGDIALNDDHPQQMAAIKEVNKIVGAYEPDKHVVIDWRTYRPDSD